MLAYSIRFLAASLGAVEAGLAKISHNIDAAARTLGASVSEMSWSVHLPLLRPALGAAALLVFVDSMKELPATLLLRPFNFDTLATQVFTLASLYRYEEAGLSALTIVAASLAPVLMLHGIIVAGRPGGLQGSCARASGGPDGPGRPFDKLRICRGRARYLAAIGLKLLIWRGLGRSAAPRSAKNGVNIGMKPRELPWKWLLLGLGTLTLGMALLPRLFGDTAQLGDRAAAAAVGLDRRRSHARRAGHGPLFP